MTALLCVNAVLALATAGFGVLAVARPGVLAGVPAGDADELSAAASFYARMYASRAIRSGSSSPACWSPT